MSRLRKVFAKIALAEDNTQLNTNLYEEGSIEKETFIIKDEVIKSILDEFDFDTDFNETPEEGVGFDFEMKASAELGIAVEHGYGKINDDDKFYIVENLNDSELAKNYIEDAAYDVSSELRDVKIQPNFDLNGHSVVLEVSTEI